MDITKNMITNTISLLKNIKFKYVKQLVVIYCQNNDIYRYTIDIYEYLLNYFYCYF